MRSSSWAVLIFSFPIIAVFISTGCNKTLAPVIPTLPNPTATPTITATMTWTPHASPTWVQTPPMGIVWDEAWVQGISGGYVSAMLSLTVNQHPEYTAGVTVTTPSGSFPMTCTGFSCPTGNYYNSGIGWTYQPGATYTLTTVTSIGTATATLVAPGGAVSITPDGSTASWQVEGNEDWFYITGPGSNWYQSNQYTINIDSPYAIPASVYSGPGTYSGDIYCQSSTYNITGASLGHFEVQYLQPITVVK